MVDPAGGHRRMDRGLALWAASPLPLATTSPSDVTPGPMPIDFSGYLLSVGMLCILLIGAVLAYRYVLGKTGQGSPRWSGLIRGRHIQVEDRQFLDPRKALFIVRVEGRRYLLGVTEQQISLLSELEPASNRAEAGVLETPAAEPPLPFLAHLAGMLRKPEVGKDK